MPAAGWSLSTTAAAGAGFLSLTPIARIQQLQSAHIELVLTVVKNHPNTYKGSLCKSISILWDYRGKQTTGQLLSPVYWVYRFISLPPWDIKLRQSLFKIRSTQLPGEIWDLDIPPGPHQVWCHTTAGMVKIMVYYENINWLNLDSQNIQAPGL